MKIHYSTHFLRSFANLAIDIQKIYREKEKIFIIDPFDKRLKTHKIKSTNVWSYSVTYKIRVIFIFEENNIILIDIGDHSIYRKRV